ncbi:UvrB/UvrC motif-containing protein [Planctomicrobium sp. SH664]|uniref:UvrB/UvrC motif-containing protein n=1 Tax=Planctomicrobium sp. SH664 TaxID=3448125 RepID=UPI003F5C436F
MPPKRIQLATTDDLKEFLGNSRYEAVLAPARSLPLTASRKEIRQSLRQEVTSGAGVYGMADAEGRLIYVGMSRRLRHRLLSYFTSQARRKKEARIGRHAKTLFWQPAAHELIAWLRERELIRQFRPNFNVQGHPTRMKLGYIVLPQQTAPSFQLAPKIPRSHAGLWGPMPLTRWTRQGIVELNFHFGLRDCPRETPMYFQGAPPPPEGTEPAACIRADLGTCLAPCIGNCTRKAYDRRLQLACRFLSGEKAPVLEELQQELKAAAQELRFEKAAKLRDRLAALQRIDLHLRRFHDWRSQAHFIYPVTSGLDGQEWWLIAVRGVIEQAVPRPRTADEKQCLLERLQQIRLALGGEGERSTLTGPDEFAAARLLFRWFRLHEDEKERRLSLAKGSRLCQNSRQ